MAAARSIRFVPCSVQPTPSGRKWSRHRVDGTGKRDAVKESIRVRPCLSKELKKSWRSNLENRVIPVVNDKQEVIFSLQISADVYREYYKGKARYVLAQSRDGRKIKFPAAVLRQFLTHEGIFGQFRLCFDDNHKLINIEKIGDKF
jgi:Protein of unknown function (DUF2835)